ncbi:hypothetical protein ZYGR_0I01630 [Zygosaccharomyces rouxii]|uniref:ZYRO0C03850p n=2 Tax=Zygosaccharomyces rouxii TaxID=4956 RepID=C5DSY0_ZYGRC|nr:uncharacterized protein ZYRO0C03850g [Zygosaccharomyces rouxii]KAH9201919.1 hypothetical protein LQ764DRAFT_208656 [Zygosaccharomyces rouxii]GAV47867.1 hypothetical protein ZYGR_0I01630 [Zygosaccharomyces rouxii]CAR26891.1 ZYRO0C03850p [Zygosaccharomyces rouxii]
MDSIVRQLEDPSIFHYKDLWLKETDNDRLLVLEIFAFGVMSDSKGIELSPGMRQKLQKLTIVTLSETHRELTYELIQSEARLDSSLQAELYLIQLRQFFEVKLDPVRKVAHIGRCYDCRDVYNQEKPLKAVKPRVTGSTLRDSLVQWRNSVNNK